MAFRYRYKPRRNYPKIGGRELRILGAGSAGVAMIIAAIFVGPGIGNFLSGFAVANIPEAPQGDCVTAQEPYTATETQETEYDYEIEEYIFENTQSGPRAFIVLRNDGPSKGTFGIVYTFSGDGRIATQTQAQDVLINERKAFVFSLASDDEMSGSFVVNAPKEIIDVETQELRNVTRCG